MRERLIAHYQIIGKLGAGGMGEVFRAADAKLEREAANDPQTLTRFEREAKLSA